MVRLKKNQLVFIKLNQEDILDLVKEELFDNFNDYGNISNHDIVSGVYFTTEADGSISVIACYQPTSLLIKEKEMINSNTIEKIDEKRNLTRNPTIFFVDDIKDILNDTKE